MSTTLERDPGDGTSADFVQRTGWGGDGIEGGLLRDFVNGAIRQHYPTDLDRVPGEAFRFATEEELDQLLAFQMELGRTNELDLNSVTINDTFGEQGRLAFMDPQIGNCNTCHGNAGGNFLATGLNRNLDTGTDELAQSSATFERPIFQGVELRDGGFGGQGLATPNFVAGLPLDNNGNPNPPNAFGDGTFNIPPLIEAADTAPFFHHHNLANLEGVIGTYGSSRFADSPAAEMVGPVPLGGMAIVEIAQFLRVVNIAFNLSLSVQRLEASELINFQYWNYREEIQIGLINLAVAEIEDALQVIAEGINLFPAQVPTLQGASDDLHAAMAASNPAARLALTRDGLDKLRSVQPELGTNLEFELGESNLMF